MPFVKRTKPNVLQVNSQVLAGKPIFIKPGINSLTQKELDYCKTVKGFRGCVKTGAIVLMDEAKDTKAVSGVQTILKMSVKDACDIIKGILNIDDLQAISEADPRKGIQNAVDAQLQQLAIDDEE